MEELKVLYFCPHQLWPTNTGARLRNFHLANALGSRMSVTMLQILQLGEAALPGPGGTAFKRVLSVGKDSSYTPGKLLRGMIGPAPVTVLNYSARRVAECLRGVLEEGHFDAVQLVSIHLFNYLKIIRSAPNKPKIILDWHNIESELMRRYAEASRNLAKRMVALRTASLLADMELEALSCCDAHTVVSEREREKLLARCPGAAISVIPNGVDTAGFASQKQSEPAGLLFVGSMDYHANEEAVLWFTRNIWPDVARDFPGLEFTIAGRSPSGTVQDLASSQIKITGTVDDVRPYYRNTMAVIVPLRVGGGTRLKILEAMAAGVPVVSTRLGAEGLDVTDKVDILLADTPQEMRFAIQQVLSDSSLRLKLSRAASQLVRNRYDWAALGEKLASLHRNVCRS